MEKQQIFDAFNSKISKTQIVNRDGEFVIQGKFCVIAPEGSGWDVWICSPDDLVNGLGERRLTSILTNLEISLTKTVFTRLNGEAHTWVRDTSLILSSLKLLGIRKKMEYSEATLKKKRLHLENIRNSKVEVS